MEIIQVSGLVKDYGQLRAVDNVSFDVKEGTIFGIIGPNGAGKTTTIECLVGLQNPSAGKILVLGQDPHKNRHRLFSQIGVQLQETVYQREAKVYELCDLFSSMYKDPLDYRALLERLDFASKEKSFIRKLSGGERQKLAITLALIANPRIVVLDELTTGLDPASRRELWSYIKELKNEGRTIVMTTHYMEEAAILCDQICLLNYGKIKAIGTVDSVIEQAQLDLIISFESEADLLSTLKELPHVKSVEKMDSRFCLRTSSEDTLTDLILLLKGQGISYRKVKIIHPELEDAYLRLIRANEKGVSPNVSTTNRL